MAKIRDFKEHYKIWKEWKANNKNSKFHQWLVLFKLVRSSTFENVKAWYYIREGLNSYNSSCTASFENYEDSGSTKDLKFNHDPNWAVVGKVDSVDCSDNGIKINVSEEKKNG